MQKVTGWLVLLLFVGACSTVSPTPSQGVMSTPVEDLPISIGVQVTSAPLPTAVAPEVIQEADANFLLLSNIYERSAPAIVNIEVDVLNSAGNPTINRGSGFVYDSQGYIITSAHVVNGALAVRVTFNDGFLTEARLIGVDTYSDLGIVQVSTAPERLHPLTLMADSDQLRVGQRAIAIGNPFGLSSSMSVGIISGLGRTLRSAELIDENGPTGFQNPSIIQTDAPINPGNSGGPLLNSQGEVMGVSTAIRSENGVFQGVGFAVPANTVRRVVPELIRLGRVNYAWMGLYVTPEENGFGVAGLSETLHLPVDAGVLVRGVTLNSPADVAGLRGGNRVVEVRGQGVCVGGDIIVAINGTYVDNLHELIHYLLIHTHPGDIVTVRIVRDRATFDVPLTLQARPDTEDAVRDCEG